MFQSEISRLKENNPSCLKVLSKITKHISQDSWYSGYFLHAYRMRQKD
jgi:hypothetical protein